MTDINTQNQVSIRSKIKKTYKSNIKKLDNDLYKDCKVIDGVVYYKDKVVTSIGLDYNYDLTFFIDGVDLEEVIVSGYIHYGDASDPFHDNHQLSAIAMNIEGVFNLFPFIYFLSVDTEWIKAGSTTDVLPTTVNFDPACDDIDAFVKSVDRGHAFHALSPRVEFVRLNAASWHKSSFYYTHVGNIEYYKTERERHIRREEFLVTQYPNILRTIKKRHRFYTR